MDKSYQTIACFPLCDACIFTCFSVIVPDFIFQAKLNFYLKKKYLYFKHHTGQIDYVNTGTTMLFLFYLPVLNYVSKLWNKNDLKYLNKSATESKPKNIRKHQIILCHSVKFH